MEVLNTVGRKIFFHKSTSEAGELLIVVVKTSLRDNQVNLIANFQLNRSIETDGVQTGHYGTMARSYVDSIQSQVDQSESIFLDPTKGESVDAGFWGGEHSGCRVHGITNVHQLDGERNSHGWRID